MRVVPLLALAALAVSGRAEASPPIGVVVSGGIGNAKADNYDWHVEHAYQLDVGVRTDPAGFVGVHLGIGAAVEQNVVASDAMFDRVAEYGYAPAQVGITVHRELSDGIWVSPWVGVQSGFRRLRCETVTDKTAMPPTTMTNCDHPGTDITAKRFAAGLSFGRDVYEDGGHRFGLIATVAYAVGTEDRGSFNSDLLNSSYTSFLVGLAYRYWGR